VTVSHRATAVRLLGQIEEYERRSSQVGAYDPLVHCAVALTAIGHALIALAPPVTDLESK
jgi:hypothetical protein